MKLNHLDLCVPDVLATKTFFETHFGFECQQIKGENKMAILKGQDDFWLVLTHDEQATYPKHFHIGFVLDTPEAVKATYERFQVAGCPIEYELAVTPRGTMFYVNAPGFIRVEVQCPTK